MKEAFVEHLIAECDRMKREIAGDKAIARAVLSHRELLALQLAGTADGTIVAASDAGRLESLRERLDRKALSRADVLLDRQRVLGIRTVSFIEPVYPAGLNDLGDARPVLLHYLGDWSLLRKPAVAVVGSRNTSEKGLLTAEDLGIWYGGTEEDREAWFCRTGACSAFPSVGTAPCVVVSGLARGCDAAAHRGCLMVGGATVAVVATGLDRGYPEENRGLQALIPEQGGLVVSERVVGGRAAGFLRARNRLIAALSGALFVVECRENSGTMHAVGCARKLGRPVFAMDYGFPNASHAGNDRLLRTGAARPVPYVF